MPDKPDEPQADYKDFAAWQDEEAARQNRLGELARAAGVTVPWDGGPPPELNADGSLKNPES